MCRSWEAPKADKNEHLVCCISPASTILMLKTHDQVVQMRRKPHCLDLLRKIRQNFLLHFGRWYQEHVQIYENLRCTCT